MLGLLLLIGGILMIVLNPFHGAIIVGGIIVGFSAMIFLIALLFIGTVAKGVTSASKDIRRGIY